MKDNTSIPTTTFCGIEDDATKPEATSNALQSDKKISVIIPCYNREKYLNECIDSILASSLPVSMLELIFVNDHSTDRTSEILKEYEQRYPENILIIELNENSGPGKTRNIAMEYATGEYICFVDSDDVVEPDMFRKLYEKIALHQCDMALCGNYMFNDTDSDKWVPGEHLFKLSITNERKRFIVKYGFRNSIWAKMYRKQFLNENNIRFPEGVLMEDAYFYHMCMMCAKDCYTIPEALYGYRQNPGGIMYSDGISKYYMDIFYVLEMTYTDLKNRRLLNGFESEYEMIYYVKALYEPVCRMMANDHGIEYDENIIETIRKAIFTHFPDITSNAYINSDKTEMNRLVLEILRGGTEGATKPLQFIRS